MALQKGFMMTNEKRLPFASDYQQGAHPRILERLAAANMEANAGYGMDAHSENARKLIRDSCDAPRAEVHFLVGGTQANAVTIDALLSPWQGVVAAGLWPRECPRGGSNRGLRAQGYPAA
jgi:threonine aldolase